MMGHLKQITVHSSRSAKCALDNAIKDTADVSPLAFNAVDLKIQPARLAASFSHYKQANAICKNKNPKHFLRKTSVDASYFEYFDEIMTHLSVRELHEKQSATSGRPERNSMIEQQL